MTKGKGLPRSWWDERTLSADGSVQAGDIETAGWIRFRLADEINRRFWRSRGVRVLHVLFEPMDGDQYSHPVVRFACQRPRASFGRLSTWRVALDALPYENAIPWAGLVPEGSEWRYGGRRIDDWATFAQEAIDSMGLFALPATGHRQCPHRDDPLARFPEMFLLAMLVRTGLGQRIWNGRWMAERTIQYTGEVNEALNRMKADPRNLGLELSPDHWLLVVADDEKPGGVIAVRYDGKVLTPAGAIDAGKLLDAGVPLLGIAERLEQSLSG